MPTVTPCLWFDGAKANRVMQAMPTMAKLDIGQLRQACAQN